MTKQVSIIVLCVDMLEMTKRCVEIIKQQTPPIYELIIVCDMPDKQMKNWLSQLEEQAKIIINEKPVGTPTALNMAIKIAQGKYIVLVNNDITVTEGWFESLMDTLLAHPEYGWVASRIIRGDVVMNFGVISSTLLLREAIDEVGLFDERFSQGVGWEDNDFLLRFWRAGYSPHGVLRSTVYHPTQPTTLKAIHGEAMPQRYELNLKLFVEKWGPDVMKIDWINIPYVE